MDSYEEYGIAYSEVDAEDWDGYPLIELHLMKANEFIDEHAANGGIVLV